MNIFPAIDLKENKCVRLSKGEDSTSVVFNENPVDQAKYFEDQGCKRLHLVDLDSAFGRNDINNKTIQNIRNAISIPIQIGGGIRSKNIAKSYFELGADFLIIGSYAVSNIQEVKNLAGIFSYFSHANTLPSRSLIDQLSLFRVIGISSHVLK